MPRLPAFHPKFKGPLTEDEHLEVIDEKPFRSLRKEIESFFGQFGFVLRARYQTREPCIYVFYSRQTLDDEQKGLILRCQMLVSDDIRDVGFEVIFSRYSKELPVTAVDWRTLSWDRNKTKWKTFPIKCNLEKDKQKGAKLVRQAKRSFERIYATELTPYHKKQ